MNGSLARDFPPVLNSRFCQNTIIFCPRDEQRFPNPPHSSPLGIISFSHCRMPDGLRHTQTSLPPGGAEDKIYVLLNVYLKRITKIIKAKLNLKNNGQRLSVFPDGTYLHHVKVQ